MRRIWRNYRWRRRPPDKDDAPGAKAWGANRIAIPGSPAVNDVYLELCPGVASGANALSRPHGSTTQVKTQIIDGGRKRWSMWFNSMQREERYGVTSTELSRMDCAFGNCETGAAWLSSARVVKCWVKSATSATHLSLCCQRFGSGTQKETAGTVNWRKVGMTRQVIMAR